MTVTIPGYEQFRPIGSGGFSTVYEARQPELNRRVAVKVLTLGADQDFDRAAFEGECRAMGTVSEHPNIVTVYGSGFSEEGLPYITMELYNETLLDKVKFRGHLPLAEVLEIGVQMAGALHRAHEDRLLHRDIKPQNIFFSQYGEPFLGDFGIAALAHEQHVQRSFGLTFHYAAPEVLDGMMPSVESDIYSLGATLYTALAGHRPFARPGQRENEATITNRILSEPPPPITAQEIPDNIERELLRLLAKHQNDRPRTALDAGRLLRDLQGRLGLTPTPLRLATIELDTDVTVSREQLRPIDQARAEAHSDSRQSSFVVPTSTSAEHPLDSASGSVTIYRAGEKARPTADFAEAEADRRWLYGVAAVVAVVVLGVVGFVIATSGGGSDLPPTAEDTETTTTVQQEVIDVSPPARVTGVEVGETGDEITITWAEAERAVSYRIDFVSGGYPSDTTEELSYKIPAADAMVLVCVQVISIGERDRLGSKSETACG